MELGYFRWAGRKGILDKPNARSSHQEPTIRGGGIIFLFAALAWFIYSGFEWPWFFVGLCGVAIISFLDDQRPQSGLLRFFIHLVSMMLLFYQVPMLDWPVLLLGSALIISIGSLSAFNFMDGINGITGIYALVTLSTFILIHERIAPFTDPGLVITLVMAVLIFLFFNFRKKAVCFAGDVGSVVLAFVQIFLLLQLIQKTQYLGWVLLVLVFGIDSVLTIVYRLSRKENIFKPHRTHLYQYLANEWGWDHRLIAILYGACQILINTMAVISFQFNHLWLIWVTGFMSASFYLVIRLQVSSSIKQAAK
ncbi:MAG: glycosyltransferase family 4 protein [Cyclobacteriaceae bacterium]|nr:glycosyltransferase family 4 protein [Cyclobacteriaceae bacterium]